MTDTNQARDMYVGQLTDEDQHIDIVCLRSVLIYIVHTSSELKFMIIIYNELNFAVD